MSSQSDLFPPPAARRRTPSRQGAALKRDIGIERAGEHAEVESPSWITRAASFIADFAVDYAKPFLIEDVIPFALARGLPAPPDGRAWGAAAQRARRDGFIRRAGYAPAKTSNLSPKVQWIVAPDFEEVQ